MINEKSISLVMVVYNSSDLVERAINSVKLIIDEILIVDQNSDIEHSIKLKSMCDIYLHTTNKGNADFDRQFAYNLASGDFILALDADEIVLEEELEKLKKLTTDYEYDVCWFLFNNNIVKGDLTINLEDILGTDPHPRFWRNRVSVNGQIMPTLIWSAEAHQFPQINSPYQIFSQIRFNHNRELDNVLTTHLNRGKNINPQAQSQEKKFIKAIFNKFPENVRNSVKLQFPELQNYLRNV